MQILEKPKDLASRVGVPISAIRYLIRSKQIDHVYTTPAKRNPLIPEGAWERYVDCFTVKAVNCDQDHLGSPETLQPPHAEADVEFELKK